MKHRNDWLARSLSGLYWMGWAAWKAGMLQDTPDTQPIRSRLGPPPSERSRASLFTSSWTDRRD